MFVCKKLQSFMLIIALCGAISDTFCMTTWAGSTWQHIKEPPCTPYALGIVGYAALTLPNYALTERIRTLREPYLDGNLSPWQFYYPAIIQGLSFGLPFAYYLAKKDHSFPSALLVATLVSCAASGPGVIAGTLSKLKEEEQLKKFREEQRRKESEEREQRRRESKRLQEDRPQATWGDYQTLVLPSSATNDEVKKAYRKLAKQFHPDKNPGDAAALARFKEIQGAYDSIMQGKK